jgi:heme oxygenase
MVWPSQEITHSMSGLLDRLAEETRSLQEEADADTDRLVSKGTIEAYRHLLTSTYGFVSPLERSLADTTGVEKFLDPRRLRKHLLLEHDLEVLGVKDLRALPQCMSIPWFDNVFDALGWAYVIERTTLNHPNVFRRLALAMPGEVAFASSFLKCYFGAVGEMWRSFCEDVSNAARELEQEQRLVEATQAGYRHYRRWRHTLDGNVPANAESKPAAARGST